MAQQVKRLGRWMVVLAPLALLVVLLSRPGPAQATTYAINPMSLLTPTPECLCAYECPSCGVASVWGDEGVNRITLELRYPITICSYPGKRDDVVLGAMYRSTFDGYSQLGYGIKPSWEYVVVKEIDNGSDPESAHGHHADVYYPNGLISTFDWDGTQYVPQTCAETASLTRPSGPTGTYLLTDKLGSEVAFNAAGWPNTFTDPAGNVTTVTYNSSNQVTGMVDDRGATYAFSQNGSGLLASLEGPDGSTWTFSYNADGCLTSIVTPATAQQTSGVTFSFGWDSAKRLTSVSDGRGNTVRSIAYTGSSRAVASITTDGNTTSFSTATGRVDRTDRLGFVHRTYHSGNLITKTDMYVGGQAKYETTYTYGSDSRLSYVVFPRGNRVDFTWDGSGNLTERRHKTSNTGSTSSTDVVHAWTYSGSRVATYTNPLGSVTTYTRDSAGNVTRVDFEDVTSPAAQTAYRTWTYNSSGQLTQATDEEGKVTAYTYHASGDEVHLLHTVEVDPTGLDLTTTFTYDSAFNVNGVTDPRGKSRAYTWDALRRLLTVTTPSPLVTETRFEYDGDGRVTKKEVQNRDKDNAVVSANEWLTTTYAYTVLGDPASVTEEIGPSTTRTFSFDHDAEQQLIRVTKPAGNKVRLHYEERGLLWKVTRGETTGVASTVERTYDANGNLVELEDGRSNATTFTVDLFDRRTRETNALGHYTEWTLDKNGQVTEVARKDSSDNTLLRQERFYDERGRLWKTEDLRKDPGQTYSDAVTTIERFKTGHVKKVTDARGKETTTTYDAAWRRTKVTDHAGNFTEWTLDENGNATAWTVHDEDGASDVEHEYEATYDDLNRRLATVEIDRTNGSNTLTVTDAYDSRGNRVWQVNAKGDPTMWVYDGLSRMTTKRVALAYGTPITSFTTYIQTTWGYDGNDRVVSHKDDAANETTWAYDALDRATTMTYPDTSEVEYGYDANDNVVSTLDPSSNLIEDTYDALNRRTQRDVTLVGSGFSDTTQETFEYDAADRLVLAQDDDYKVQYTHAVLGLESLPYEEKQSYATGTAYLKTVTRTWDAVGNKATETYPSGLALAYTWSDVSLLTGISDGTNTVATWTYGGLRRKQLDLQNGTKTTYAYTGFRGEVATIHHKTSSNATVLQLDYGYDANHDRLYERFGGSGSAGDAFEYDKARRLTTAWMGSATPTAPSGAAYVTKIQYAMDDTGNRTSVVTTPYGSSPATSSYTTNNLNQYTAVGGTSRTHDGNGNVDDDGTYLYDYNYKNLIVKVTRKSDSAVVAEYKYDALGRRVEKVVTGGTYRYIYSGVETVSVYTSTGTWKQDYVYGEGIDEVVMLEQADVLDYDADTNTSETTRSFYHANALGSVMEVTDMSQAVAVSYRYDPYGNITITRGGSSQSSDPLGQYVTYTGRWHDEETGLYHYRARAYDSARGRFLQRDTLGVAVNANLYEYARSAPNVYCDPEGEEEEKGVFEKIGEFLADAAGAAVDLIDKATEAAAPSVPLAAAVQLGLHGPVTQAVGEALGEVDRAVAGLTGVSPKSVRGWRELLMTLVAIRSARGKTKGPTPSPPPPPPARPPPPPAPVITETPGAPVYYPKGESGAPVRLPRRDGMPIPDPLAEGRPHTQLGGKISDRTGRPYPQHHQWPEHSPESPGYPLRRLDGGDHGRPLDHPGGAHWHPIGPRGMPGLTPGQVGKFRPWPPPGLSPDPLPNCP